MKDLSRGARSLSALSEPTDNRKTASVEIKRAVCMPCGLQLEQPDRLEHLQRLLEHEEDPLVLLTHLLRWCRDDHDVLWEHAHEETLPLKLGGLSDLRTAADSRSTVGKQLRRAMADVLTSPSKFPSVVAARSLAVFLDDWFWPTFRDSFARRSPYQPGVGDPTPLDTPDFRDLTDMTPTSPPWRLANRLDETRHVRLAGEWAVQFRVVFDYSASDALSGLISPDTVVATCHPNESMSELSLGETDTGTLFPVTPRDPQRQTQIINELLAAAYDVGASIVVLPELATTERIAVELESWVRRDEGPDLVVVGSYHHEVNDVASRAGRRANTALAWVRGHAEPLTHDKHSPGDRPTAEGIHPQGWPELRVYVGADGFHLVIAICRDLLNPSAVHALTEVGANLVLVPAMSETLTPFVGSAANLVTASQALVAVSNNPARWPGDGDGRTTRRPARALFGHPGLGQLTRLVEPGDPSPGVVAMKVSSGQLTWVPAHSATEPGGHPHRQPSRPDWVTDLATATCVTVHDVEVRSTGPRRRAAVLVLLSDRGGEPCVVLTGRATGLSRYPGRVVFPGGLVEPSDPSVAAAAVREANEETGVDLSRLDILGMMAPMALTEDDLLVYPVLGWLDQDGAPSWSVNYAEVDSIAEVPLRLLAGERPGIPSTVPRCFLRTDQSPSAELGDVTRAILDRLLGAALRTGFLRPVTVQR